MRSIDGLNLPTALIEAIEDGAWRAPDDRSLLARVFPEPAVKPYFLGINGIIRENEAWHLDDEQSVREAYIGVPNSEDPPGDIDPDSSLLIGFLGPDQHIALDYRESSTQPTVLYLTAYRGWVRIASSIEDLLCLLRLDKL